MKLLIVIVNYNGRGITADCLDSIAPIIGEVPDTHVGLCDNGSAGEDAAQLADLLRERGYDAWCQLTAISPNLGFTGGNNAIIRPFFPSPQPPDYVLLLNNDTLVHPGAFKHLVDFMDANPSAGCAGSRLEDPDGTPQVSAFRFFNLLNEFQGASRLGPIYRVFKRFAVGMPIPQSNQQVDWVAGASLIIRRSVIEKIGTLDDAFYTYFDDIDYCRSAKEAGFPTWYVPASRVVHLVGQTTGITHAQGKKAKAKRRADYWFQARHRYWLKHHGKLKTAMADAAFLSGLALCRLRSVLGGPDHNLPDRFFRDFLSKSVFVRGFAMPHVTNPDTGGPNPTTPTVVGVKR